MRNPDSGRHGGAEEKKAGPGLPLRGLAMILIAVAVLLAVWALWSMNSRDSGTGAVATTSSSTQAGSPAATASPATTTGAETATTESTTLPQTTAPASPAAPAAAGGAAEPVRTLHVLNNSTVPQLAARVADELRGDFPVVESGNLPDVLLPENTVYFTPGNPDAEQKARELAERVGGVAQERSDALPKETEGRDSLVLVLVQDTAL